MILHDYLWLFLDVVLKSNGCQIQKPWFWASLDHGVPDSRNLWLHRGARGTEWYFSGHLCVWGNSAMEISDDHLNSERSDEPRTCMKLFKLCSDMLRLEYIEDIGYMQQQLWDWIKAVDILGFSTILAAEQLGKFGTSLIFWMWVSDGRLSPKPRDWHEYSEHGKFIKCKVQTEFSSSTLHSWAALRLSCSFRSCHCSQFQMVGPTFFTRSFWGEMNCHSFFGKKNAKPESVEVLLLNMCCNHVVLCVNIGTWVKTATENGHGKRPTEWPFHLSTNNAVLFFFLVNHLVMLDLLSFSQWIQWFCSHLTLMETMPGWLGKRAPGYRGWGSLPSKPLWQRWWLASSFTTETWSTTGTTMCLGWFGEFAGVDPGRMKAPWNDSGFFAYIYNILYYIIFLYISNKY